MLYYERTFIEYLAFIHAKLALMLWGVLYFLYPSQIMLQELGKWLVGLSAFFAIVGSSVGIIGLTLSSSKNVKRRVQGLIIEASGLTVALCGPLSYFVTSAYLTIHLNESHRHAYTAIAYALCAATLSRIIVVRRGLKRGG